MDIKRILSKQTHNQLEKHLIACKTSTPRGEDTQYELLRELLAELFSLKQVLLYPKQVLVDLAETIQDFHIEQNNLEDYIHHTKNYVNYQLKNYHTKRKQLSHKVNWERGRKGSSYLGTYEQLDLFYLEKSYKEGYHYQQSLMYRLLLDIINKIQEEGIL